MGWRESGEHTTLPATAESSSLPPNLLRELRQAVAAGYEVEQEIGSGGMALVFRARDIKHDRPVALKVLRPELASRVGRERFLREIQLAAKLTHPHILPLHDSGASGSLLYYVMPFVAGASLRERLECERCLTVDEVMEIGRAVAGALDFAHRNGVVHRDIKPENIMMHDGVPVVTDFGIGKAVSDAGGQQLTQTGTAMGTPAYMSPEQMYGEETLDGRSDIYSLGLVLLEMLTGSGRFTGPSAQAILARRAANPDPEIQFPDGVPDPIRHSLRSAMAERPDDRPRTAAEFAAELVGAARGTLATPATPQPMQAAPPSVAVLPFQNMSGDEDNEYFSDGVTEEIINALTQLEGLHVAARTSSFSFKGQTLDVKEVGRRLNVGAVLEGSVRQAGNRLRVTAQLVNVADGYHLWSERYDREMDDVFAVHDEIAGAIAERLSVTLGTGPVRPVPRRATANLDAYRLYLKGRHQWNTRSEAGLEQACRLFNEAIALDPAYAPAYSGLADTYLLLGSYGFVPRAEASAKARTAAEKALELDEGLAEAHASLGQAYRHERRWEDEEREYERAIQLNPGYATAHQWYATLLAALGRMDEAVAEVRRAEELDPLSHAISITVANVLYLAGDIEGADEQVQKTRELKPDFFSAIAWAAAVAAERGRFEEATRLHEQVAEMWGHQNGNVLVQRAVLQIFQGDWDAAEATLEEAVAADADPGFVAYALVARGDFDEAFRHLELGVRQRSWWTFYLKVHPAFQPLQTDPRYHRLIEELGLSD